MGSGRLLRIKGKLRRLFDDLDDSPSHPRRDSTLRYFKRTTDEGSLVIAVPLTSSSSSPSIFPRFSGSSSSFEQPDKARVFKDVKLQMAFGRLERFLQCLRSNVISRLRFPREA